MSSLKFLDLVSHLNFYKDQQKDFCLVTLVQIIGGAPQEVGAKILVTTEGLQHGTVGGGKVEKRAIEEAQKLVANKTTDQIFVHWNLQKDIGMTCGGAVSFFFEVFRFETMMTVAVFGAGHISQELVPLLTRLNAQVICIDPRDEWLGKLKPAQNLKLIQTDNMKQIVDELPDKSFVVITTMGHAFDLPILTEAMKQRDRLSYVGNVGSDQKALRLRNDLRTAGLPESQLSQFFCPIGENFGKNQPFEIALSIISQILKVRDQLES